MKIIEVNFRIDGYCNMLLNVPDDYQVPSTNPVFFWKDLEEKLGDQIEMDPFNLDGANWDLPLGSHFQIMEVESVELMWIALFGKDGFEYETKLDDVPIYK